MARDRTRRWLATFVLAIGVAAIVWQWLREPLLEWEDGALLFARSYDEFHFRDWFEPYGGYVPVGTNLLASLLCLLPTDWIPAAFVAGAAAVSLAAGAAFLRPNWQSVAPFYARVLVAAIIAWLPLASHLERTNLAYAQWPAMWWLLMVLFEPGQERSWGRSGWVVLLAMWHPLALLLVPVAVWNLWWVGFDRRWWALLVALGLSWGLRAVVGGGSGGPDAPAWPGGLELARLLAVRVGLESLIGSRLTAAIGAVGDAWLAVASVASTALIGTVLVRGARRLPGGARRVVVQLLTVCVAAVVVSAIVRSSCRSDLPGCGRYLAIARQAVLAGMVVMLARQLSPRALVLAALVVAACLLDGNRAAFRHPGPDRKLQTFLAELQRQEGLRGGRTWIRALCERPRYPPIVVRPH